ncbi:hypothetical protein [Melaminivora alkalimesophila]|uniref:Uncharacterized protein n=1 Tax=Melaminivora alkalimesophila TaxID=1165852 RepID=A0A317R9B4_9BURK|nr:hypothetical protein [Melaminivora alkalimesophila]PWW44431.1 hypothetical protein DFR36_108108 [Melaminivora alkalimesophila]
MRLQRALAALACLWCLAAPAQDLRELPGPLRVWPNIPVVRAADLADYEADRKVFGDLHADKADPAKVAAALQAIDALQAHHEQRALAEFGRSLNAQLIGELDRQARRANLAQPRLRFDFSETSPSQLQQPLAQDELKARAARVALAAYITYTRLEGPLVQATATLVRLRSGASQSFTVTAPAPALAEALARELFDYFEGTRFAPPRNPTPGAQWLTAAPGHADRLVSREVALRWCDAQGAQLPTADELATAEAAGFYGGGLALRPGGVYHVQSGLYDTGAAAAGTGALRANHLASVPNGQYYCIRRAPAPMPAAVRVGRPRG